MFSYNTAAMRVVGRKQCAIPPTCRLNTTTHSDITLTFYINVYCSSVLSNVPSQFSGGLVWQLPLESVSILSAVVRNGV